MAVTFVSEIHQAEGMSATGIPVPASAVAELGGSKNAAVSVSVRKQGEADAAYGYRGSIGSHGGRPMISLSSAHRDASGLRAGDAVDVTLELDTTPRVVELPADAREALVAAGALDAFTALSHSRQRALVDPIVAAKAEDTRARRVEKLVAAILGA